MSDTLYKIKVMQAWEDGKEIKFPDGSGGFTTLQKKIDGSNPGWNWPNLHYEIVPDTVYANIYDNGDKAFHDNETKACKLAGDKAIRVAVKYEEVMT